MTIRQLMKYEIIDETRDLMPIGFLGKVLVFKLNNDGDGFYLLKIYNLSVEPVNIEYYYRYANYFTNYINFLQSKYWTKIEKD